MNGDEKVCPRCAETVKAAAVVCRYCGHEFGEVRPPDPIQAASESPAASHWLPPRSNVPDDPSAASAGDWRSQLGKVAGFGCLGLLGLVFLGAVLGSGAQDANTSAVDSTNKAMPINSFDNMSASAGEEAPASDWRTSTSRDEVRGRTIHHAEVTSENAANFDFPYAGGSRLTITVRKHPEYGEDVIFQISDGQFVCGIYNCKGAINFGKGPETLTLSSPADHDSKTLFATYGPAIIRQLKQSDRVVVELPFYQEGNRQFTFQTKGLVWPPKS